MKEIDFIYKNFDPSAFIKNLNKSKKKYQTGFGFNFLVDIVLDSVRDINQLKNTINRYQFTNTSEIKVFKDFVKKYGDNYSDKDIESFFFKKMNILNSRKSDDLSNDLYDLNSLMAKHIESGEFFRHFKKDFDITFYGQVTYTKHTYNDNESFGTFRDYYCLHIKSINKFYLFFFQHNSRATEMEFAYVTKIFNKKPTSVELIRLMKKGDKETYPDKEEIITKRYRTFNFDKAYNRIFSDGYKLKHEIKPHFLNEQDYFNFHNSKGESHIAQMMAISNPEKYFKKYFKDWKQVAAVMGAYKQGSFGTYKPKKREKVKDNKFFEFVMSEKLNYRNNIKFIEEIIYSYDDLEGFLKYVPLKIQESKELKEEIRILRMFRSNNKKFIIEVFNKNEDKLETLAKNYMPNTIFDDPKLMFELIKLDSNFSADIGKKLKKNKVFMSKVNKHLDNL